MIATEVEKYKDAMRDAVCGVCAYFAQDKQNPGRCIHENSGQCSLFAKLDEVVEVVSHVNSGSIEPYIEELRRNVCANCEHQNEQGICDVRDARGPVPEWCTLDAYFNLVVGAVEDVQRRSEVMKSASTG
jgi:hypothetical protein